MSVEYVCMAREIKSGMNASRQRPRKWVTVFRTRDQAEAESWKNAAAREERSIRAEALA